MNLTKSKTHHKYYGTLKSTFEHCYTLDDYLQHKESLLERMPLRNSIARKFFEDGRTKETEFYRDGELEYKTTVQYNKSNKIVSSLTTDPLGNPIRKNEYFYDRTGLKKEWWAYSDMENLDFRMIYIYNPMGDLLSETIIHENQEDNLTTNFAYDADNTVIITTQDAGGRYVGKTIEKYDDAKNLIVSRSYDESGRLTHERSNTYDLHCNILTVKIKSYAEEGVSHYGREYKYEYDPMDNWIKVFSHHEPQHIEGIINESGVCIREIEYYQRPI